MLHSLPKPLGSFTSSLSNTTIICRVLNVRFFWLRMANFYTRCNQKELQEKEYAMNTITCDHTLLLKCTSLRSQTCMHSQSHMCLIYLHACTHTELEILIRIYKCTDIMSVHIQVCTDMFQNFCLDIFRFCSYCHGMYSWAASCATRFLYTVVHVQFACS